LRPLLSELEPLLSELPLFVQNQGAESQLEPKFDSSDFDSAPVEPRPAAASVLPYL